MYHSLQTESIASDNLQCFISSRLISPTDGFEELGRSGSLVGLNPV